MGFRHRTDVLGGNRAGDWEGVRPGFTSLSIQRLEQT